MLIRLPLDITDSVKVVERTKTEQGLSPSLPVRCLLTVLLHLPFVQQLDDNHACKKDTIV